jgi:hypothetical protein
VSNASPFKVLLIFLIFAFAPVVNAQSHQEKAHAKRATEEENEDKYLAASHFLNLLYIDIFMVWIARLSKTWLSFLKFRVPEKHQGFCGGLHPR